MRITLVTLFVLFLASCSPPFFKKNIEILSYENYKNSLPSKLTNSFQLKGKVSLFINKKGQTGKILWEFNDNKHTIHILNPFNTKIALKEIDPNEYSDTFEELFERIWKEYEHLGGLKCQKKVHDRLQYRGWENQLIYEAINNKRQANP